MVQIAVLLSERKQLAGILVSCGESVFASRSSYVGRAGSLGAHVVHVPFPNSKPHLQHSSSAESRCTEKLARAKCFWLNHSLKALSFSILEQF